MMYYLEHFNTLVTLLVSLTVGGWATVDSQRLGTTDEGEWQCLTGFSYASMVALGACVSQMLAHFGVVPSVPVTEHFTSAYMIIFGILLGISMTEPKFEEGQLIFSFEEFKDNTPAGVVAGVCVATGGIHYAGYLYNLIGKA